MRLEKQAVAGLWKALKTTLRIGGIIEGSKVVKGKLIDLPVCFRGCEGAWGLFLFSQRDTEREMTN